MIEDYFNKIIEIVLVSRAVASFKILRKEVTEDDGYIRFKCELLNSDIFKFAEYVGIHKNKVTIETYSYHWQKADGTLIKRWDNVPHHKELDTFPHHLHLANGKAVSFSKVPLVKILSEIEETIIINGGIKL